MIDEYTEGLPHHESENVTISAYWMVRDEAENLERSLKSVMDAVDEVLVLDTGSTDETMDIARRCGARVVERPWNDDAGDMCNYGLSLLSGDVIIRIDGDEYFDPPLGPEHRRIMQTQFHPASENLLSVTRIDIDPDTGQELFREQTARIHHGHGALHFEGKWHELYHFANGQGPTRLFVPGFVMIHLGFTQKAMERKVPRNLAIFRHAIETSKNEKERCWYKYFLVREYYDNSFYEEAGEEMIWFLEKPGRPRNILKQYEPHAPYFAAMLIEIAGRSGMYEAASILKKTVIDVFCNLYSDHPISYLLPLWQELWLGCSDDRLLKDIDDTEQNAEKFYEGQNRNDMLLTYRILSVLHTSSGRALWYRGRKAEALLHARKGVKITEWPSRDAVVMLAECATALPQKQAWFEVAGSLLYDKRSMVLVIDACLRRSDRKGAIEWMEHLIKASWGGREDALLLKLLQGKARTVSASARSLLKAGNGNEDTCMCLFFATLCGTLMTKKSKSLMGNHAELYDAFKQSGALQNGALFKRMLRFYPFIALCAGRQIANRVLMLFVDERVLVTREMMLYYLDAKLYSEYFEEAPAKPAPKPGDRDTLLLVELAICAGHKQDALDMLNVFSASPTGKAGSERLQELLRETS